MDTSELDSLIGINLRRLRTERGLTQAQIAKKINAEKGKISSYENGHEGIGKDVLTRLCNALKIQPWEFYLTPDAPLISDPQEKDAVYTIREARSLGVAEDIAKYGRFLVQDAKRRKKIKNE